MAKKNKRPYGTGCVIKVKSGLAVRWRESEIAPDGSEDVNKFETPALGI